MRRGDWMGVGTRGNIPGSACEVLFADTQQSGEPATMHVSGGKRATWTLSDLAPPRDWGRSLEK